MRNRISKLAHESSELGGCIIQNDATTVLFPVIPARPLCRHPVAIEDPVSEISPNRKNASKKSLLDQHLQLAQTGQPKFVLYGTVFHSGITTELAKGDASYGIPSLFDVHTHSEHWFNHLGTLLGARDLMKVIDDEGIEAGIEAYREMAQQERTFQRYYFPEWSMRSTGMQYLHAGQIENAIGIFRLTTQEYPESWQAYTDLAASYAKNGDRENAILNYEKALSMNPEGTEIKEALSKMRR